MSSWSQQQSLRGASGTNETQPTSIPSRELCLAALSSKIKFKKGGRVLDSCCSLKSREIQYGVWY
jgi:hypothetical protein